MKKLLVTFLVLQVIIFGAMSTSTIKAITSSANNIDSSSLSDTKNEEAASKGVSNYINNQNLIVYYDWEGDISINQWTEIYEKSIPWRKVFKLNLNTWNYALIISDIYKQNPLRNIHVVREDQDELFKKWVIFNPDWINSIKWYKTINFSQWINISMKNIIWFLQLY